MDQPVHIMLAIDKVHTPPQRALDCRPGLGRLNQVYGFNCPTPSREITTFMLNLSF